MNSQTLKRQAEDISFNNDDLNDEDNEVTWGNKKARYLYTYTLQSPDLISNISDSETESIYSIQSKSTIQVSEDISSLSSSSSSSDCDSGYKNSSPTEVEVNEPDISQENVLKTSNLIFPGFFKNCLLCRKVNSNPDFQYCNKCFKYRLQLFESKSDPKPKSIKRLTKMSSDSGLGQDSFDHSQESGGSFGLSNLCLTQESTTDISKKSMDLCNICLLKPKNGVFNHRKIGHRYCCYLCAKKIWAKTGRCPVCKLKIRYVTKIIFV